jgi:hypothetical protein
MSFSMVDAMCRLVISTSYRKLIKVGEVGTVAQGHTMPFFRRFLSYSFSEHLSAQR